MRMKYCVLGIAMACACLTQVQAATIEGINLPDSLELGARKLMLNGAGVRVKVVVKVYVAGLYLEQKTSNAQVALTHPGAKRVALVMLRDVESEELGRLFIRGIEENTKRADQPRLLPSIVVMSQLFSKYKRLTKGESLVIDYIPGRPMNITVRGKTEDTGIRDPEFMSAMLAIWLGDQPADHLLKAAMLGKSNTEVETNRSGR